jgi:hypothetical protein
MARRGRGERRRAIVIVGADARISTNLVPVVPENDEAQAITILKKKAIGIASELDSAQVIVAVTSGAATIGLANETDASQAITKAKRRTLGIATQTNTALPITFKKGLGTNLETDTAIIIVPFIPPPVPPGPGAPSIWRVELYPLNGGTKIIDLPVQSWMFNYVLDGPGAFEADVQLTHALATEGNIAVGKREIRVFRATSLVWGGYLWGVTASAVDYKLRLRGEGYFSRLRRRVIANDLVKKQVDQADIAWQLIQYSQSTHGTFNITDGHINTGVKIDHVYCATDLGEVGSAITELSEMDDSFDFWITPTITDASNKVFKNASPRRGTTKAVTINQDNAISADYEIDAIDLANRIWGIGQGDCNPPSFEATANASITDYGELHAVEQYDDLDHLPSVKAHTREELRLQKAPRRQVTVRLEERDYTWGSFDVGDIITLASNRGYLTDSRQMRVIRIQANFDPENTIAFYEMDLDSVVGA